MRQTKTERGELTLEFTEKMLISFMNKLISFDRDICSAMEDASDLIKDGDANETANRSKVIATAEQGIKRYAMKTDGIIADHHKQIDKILSIDFERNNSTFLRLQKCKEKLALVKSAEKSITNKSAYAKGSINTTVKSDISIDSILEGRIDFAAKAHDVNESLFYLNNASATNVCTSFYNLCRTAEHLLVEEIITLRGLITQNIDDLHQNYLTASNDKQKNLRTNLSGMNDGLADIVHRFALLRDSSCQESKRVYISSEDILIQKYNKLINGFCKQFPPTELAEEYKKLYAIEPIFEDYKCFEEMPRGVRIGSLVYDISSLHFSDYTKSFLDRYYPYMYKGNEIAIPFCTYFGSEFNYLFRFNGEGRQQVVNDACNLGMRLFMMLPPGKLNFTFIDPVTLGESFAMFTRLVDVDDRTSEVINGKIWSFPTDIEEKLKIMTDHISNVTQRCLQGKFDNIYEYNRVAEQNAEAYQILMLMDYPAGLTDQSLKLLEQIVTSGPKCGVFTIIYRNESQFKKISERSHPLVANIETSFQKFDYNNNATIISCNTSTVKDKPIHWKGLLLPEKSQMDGIITTLKKGIKHADRVVVGIEKVSDAEISLSTKNGIRIPIGVRGAKEVQYLTLGVGGSHHALVAGITRSGKSSLLHTIILQALSQYRSPDELSLYLVDFKRGVEFQIYADFVLPVFRVVAIETEREFGYNILAALEKEQQRRAVLFKRAHVDKIEEYRDLPESGRKAKMPRVLVIMDEFHELFQNTGDEIGKKSSELIERIVRQGAAFGIHLILSSQSYSNISGIDKAVFDQMAVRIVLKCSKSDANMLLDNGSSEIDQISIDDPGRAVYNSEAGNKEYNSHFRVAYIDPSIHRSMLQEISDDTRKYVNPDKPTRILLSNIEDNRYCIFNQFDNYSKDRCNVLGRLYIGEPLTIENNLHMELVRNRYANMLIIGPESETARSMFAFTILSLAINYWISHGKKYPSEPFIYLLNYKPLRDSFFEDIPKEMATELLTKYVTNVPIADYDVVRTTISNLHSVVIGDTPPVEVDKYLMVFGYQRAEDLKSSEKEEKEENILSLMSSQAASSSYSMKEMMETILIDGSQRGVHVIMWQDDFKSMDDSNRKMITYFYHKIAYGMFKEDYSKFVGVNDVSQLGENTAVYSNRTDDNMNFRPYQSPDESWVASICEKLQ